MADRGVSITIAYPPTVTGTGFRAASLMGAVTSADTAKNTMTLKVAVDEIMMAADKKADNLFPGGKYWLANYLYPIFPQMFDGKIRAEATIPKMNNNLAKL